MIRSGKGGKGAGRPLNVRETTIGQIITKLRMEAALTQDQMARRMYTSKNTVCAWETGRKHPNLTTLEKLAEVTGTRLEIRFV